jgi:all-trans-retinol 13,14-reductase
MSIIPSVHNNILFHLFPNITLKNPDVLIIGSGIGSMSAGAALSKFGYKVLLLEQHYIPGGLTQMFSRKGFNWESGIHGVGTVQDNALVKKMYDSLSSKKVLWKSLGDIYEEINFPNRKINVHAGLDKYYEELIKLFPREKVNLLKYKSVLVRAASQSLPMYLMKRFSFKTAAVLNFILGIFHKNWWNTTTEKILSRYNFSDELKTILASQMGYYGSLPSESSFAIHSLVLDHYKNGSYFPAGGSKSIAEGLLLTIVKAGGEIICKADVKKILFDKNKAYGVELVNGAQILCKKIISGIGAKATTKLCSDNTRLSKWSTSINNIKNSPSYICMNVGFQGDITQFGAEAKNRWYYSTWDLKEKYWDFENNPTPPIVYISFPSLKDSENINNSSHTMEAIAFVKWENFSNWENSKFGKRPEDYTEFKKILSEKFSDYLKSIMPDIMKMAIYSDLSTPLSNSHFVRSNNGAIYGLEATPERFRNPYLRVLTPAKGLYMTGIDTTAMGMAGGLVSGIMTASRLKFSILKLLA